ncbi:helix-turn-helix domain-containing protein [Romeria aff. gracilis LEGE 07310]|uniref:Helix-turn-helix domain-containing protein n=1 Tax=Vasconcelosia minhoensis LEGE 07310 TaxID=915328 RepID=A0A8J7AQ05_9CYAN|nr:helix-turn-helix domain-containing protein [Romeria aff. gracilis LEGE 07310]
MAKRRIRNKDLAAALEITENSVYRLRKATEMPRLTPQRLEGICIALGCQPGELLERVSELGEPTVGIVPQGVLPAPVLVQNNGVNAHGAISQAPLQRLTQFYPQILALSWRGYRQFGPGAIIFTALRDGGQIAYVEKDKLSDPNCRRIIEQNRPEISAVVLYYKSDDYSTGDYEILTLTGPKSPPECADLLEGTPL